MTEQNIPEQYTGVSVDVVSESAAGSVERAKIVYGMMQSRLLEVNRWQEFSGKKMAKFTLYDRGGNPVFRPVEIGDYFRIEIPAPDNESGNGDDWVEVQTIVFDTDEKEPGTIITVKPVSCPLNSKDGVAHFLSDEASSTFIVRRSSDRVFAEVHGRNEKPNVKDVDLKEKIRNTLVTTGSVIGFSKLQWKLLTDGIINFEE